MQLVGDFTWWLVCKVLDVAYVVTFQKVEEQE